MIDTNEPVLYRRAKASDMIQGMADMIRLIQVEHQKVSKFHGGTINAFSMQYSQYTTFMNYIDNAANYSYDLDRLVIEMRRQGL